MQKPMKLSQLEKRIQQNFTNSKTPKRPKAAGQINSRPNKKRPGHCTNQIHPRVDSLGCPRVPFQGPILARQNDKKKKKKHVKVDGCSFYFFFNSRKTPRFKPGLEVLWLLEILGLLEFGCFAYLRCFGNLICFGYLRCFAYLSCFAHLRYFVYFGCFAGRPVPTLASALSVRRSTTRISFQWIVKKSVTNNGRRQ